MRSSEQFELHRVARIFYATFKKLITRRDKFGVLWMTTGPRITTFSNLSEVSEPKKQLKLILNTSWVM